MDFKNIKYSEDNGIITIQIDRPKAYNAMNTETNHELEAAMNQIDDNVDARVLIIRGSEKVFVAGADVTELMDADPRAAFENASVAHRVFHRLENLRIPTIAAVTGPALGGGLELALSCDFRIAGEHAVFGLPEINLGIIPGAGGTQRLAKLVGVSRAKEMIFLGDKIDCAKAEQLGLVNIKVADDEVFDVALKTAEQLRKRPAVALSLAKECVNFGVNCSLEKGREFEKMKFSMAFATADQKEGMKAFTDKRKPEFINK